MGNGKKIAKGVLDFMVFLMTQETSQQREISKRGREGEESVGDILEDLHIKTLSNLYVPNGYGTSEIDLMFVHETGIYVMEVKNYRASIYGDSKHEKWTAYYSKNQKYTLYNPILQNDSHINVLKHLLGYGTEKLMKSYVVFSDDANLDNVYNHRRDTKVCTESEYRELIYNAVKRGKKVLSKKEVQEIYDMLKQYTKASRRVKKEHIKEVKELRKSK